MVTMSGGMISNIKKMIRTRTSDQNVRSITAASGGFVRLNSLVETAYAENFGAAYRVKKEAWRMGYCEELSQLASLMSEDAAGILYGLPGAFDEVAPRRLIRLLVEAFSRSRLANSNPKSIYETYGGVFGDSSESSRGFLGMLVFRGDTFVMTNSNAKSFAPYSNSTFALYTSKGKPVQLSWPLGDQGPPDMGVDERSKIDVHVLTCDVKGIHIAKAARTEFAAAYEMEQELILLVEGLGDELNERYGGLSISADQLRLAAEAVRWNGSLKHETFRL